MSPRPTQYKQIHQRIYLGVRTSKREIFTWPDDKRGPNEKTHGHMYTQCIGPFKTWQGADFMRQWGRDNPHCQTVDQAEMAAAKWLKDNLKSDASPAFTKGNTVQSSPRRAADGDGPVRGGY